MPTPIDYRRARDRPSSGLPPARRSRAFRIGLACWGVPLVIVVGSAAVTPAAPRLGFAGLSIGGLIGLALTPIGVMSVATFLDARWKWPTRRLPECVWPALLVLGLIASNYVVATAAAYAVLRLSFLR